MSEGTKKAGWKWPWVSRKRLIAAQTQVATSDQERWRFYDEYAKLQRRLSLDVAEAQRQAQEFVARHMRIDPCGPGETGGGDFAIMVKFPATMVASAQHYGDDEWQKMIGYMAGSVARRIASNRFALPPSAVRGFGKVV